MQNSPLTFRSPRGRSNNPHSTVTSMFVILCAACARSPTLDFNPELDATNTGSASGTSTSGTTAGDPTQTSSSTASTMEQGSSTDAGSSETTEDDPACGDGVVDGDEECDDGPDNDNSGACLTTCKLATCHDGFLYEGVEECDDGNNVDSDACTFNCKKAACGDGLLWEGNEECDDGNLKIGDGCDSTCAHELLVFVSSQEYPGNLSPNIGNYTGLDLGDAHCQQLADAAKHPGTFRAWLSNGAVGPKTRFGLKNFTGYFIGTGGTIIAKGWADLVDGQLSAPISHDENGDSNGGAYAWSGTNSYGDVLVSDHCSGWQLSSDSAYGYRGYSGSMSAQWTQAGKDLCNTGAHLYCFQVSLD